MFDRFIRSIDYRLLVILIFSLGLKLSFAIGILLIVALVKLGITHTATVLVMFIPMVAWSAWVFKDMNLFSHRVKRLLGLD